MTGATGALGPVLIRSLLTLGWRVRILCRQAPVSKLDDVNVFIGDIRDRDAVLAAVEGVSTVFHAAALLHRPRSSASDASLYEAINVGGARNVAQAASLHRAAVVFFSTIAVYGPTSEPADEQSPPRPIGLYARTKLEAERVLQGAGLDIVVLRLAAVYGRRLKGNYERLETALRRGIFVPIGRGSNRRTLIHESDAVWAAILAAERATTSPGVYNVTDGQTHSVKEILAAMCSALGRAEPRFHFPIGLARLLARGVGRMGLFEKYVENVEVKGQRIQDVMGFRPQFDLATGWREALAPPPPSEGRTRG